MVNMAKYILRNKYNSRNNNSFIKNNVETYNGRPK